MWLQDDNVNKDFRRLVKEQGLSFTLAMVYAVCKCANKIEAFRYRFVDGQVVLFDWGKYYEKDGKILMPISVQAHHSFVDGLHIGQFAEQLQKFLSEC